MEFKGEEICVGKFREDRLADKTVKNRIERYAEKYDKVQKDKLVLLTRFFAIDIQGDEEQQNLNIVVGHRRNFNGLALEDHERGTDQRNRQQPDQRYFLVEFHYIRTFLSV